MSRTIDSEALREFADAVQPEWERSRDELIPMLEPEGPLSKMPAFGILDNADGARGDYAAFHETMWEHAQQLRQALEGLHGALAGSADDSDASDAASAADLENQNQG